MTRQRVLIPEHPASRHYHALDCGTVNRDRGAVLAEDDARDLGYRPHICLTHEWNGPKQDGNDAPEVPV